MVLNSARDLFFNNIYKYMESQDIYIVSADLAGLPFDAIRRDYPHRYISVGIAEQNMISVSCGLALCGKKVIAYSSNPFIALRAFDQIRNAIGILNVPVTVVGVGTGFSISEYGTTHFTTEDYQIMTLCPNMNIITVTDDAIAEKCVEYFISSNETNYMRFDKLCTGILPSTENIDMEKGFRIIKFGKNIAIVSNGYMTHLANKIVSDIEPTIIDVFKHPFNTDILLRELEKYDEVIIYEEQQRRGGLGSELLEILNDKGMSISLKRLGINYGSEFPHVYGSREYWLEKYSLNIDNLQKELEETNESKQL